MGKRKNLKIWLVIIALPLVIQHLVGPQVYAVSRFVPDVVGLAQSAAETSITSADLVVGTISHGYSDTVPAGNVISQYPLAGVEVPQGTEVHLIISLGHQIVTIYVDDDANGANDGSSWADAYTELQSALDAVMAGDEIWVAEGTYLPDYNVESGIHTGSRTATFQLISGVALYGGYAGVNEPDPNERDVELYETILSGDLNGDDEPNFVNYSDNSYHVVTGSGTDATATLDGFTITGGNANGSWEYFQTEGGGMYNNAGSPTVTNCKFTANSAVVGGGMMNWESSSPTVTNCTFSGNSADWDGGGMFNWQSSSPTVSNCTFSGNLAADGGGICNYENSSPMVTNCTFIENSAPVEGGGGIHNSTNSPATITNCTFTGNSGFVGGGIWNYQSNPTVTNCLFVGNLAANYGGGMSNTNDCNPTLTNCTFAGNVAPDGNAISCDFLIFGGPASPSTIAITNCILWDGGGEVYNGDGSTITITYSDVQGGWPDEGNIDVDPLFVDADGDDNVAGTQDDNLRLLAASPCIDAGDNTAVPADTTDLDGDGNTTEPIPFDLDGNPRIVDGNDDGNSVVDMGAYEYEAMVSCFGVNHVKLETKAGKKGNKVELKGTFSPALPIDFAVDDVAYIIDDGQGNALVFLIPAGSFEVDGKPDKQKFKFDSPKGSQPDIKAKFDFDKCKFELKAKRVQGTDEITSTTLTIELWAGANVAQEIVELEVKGKKGEHLEYKRKPKFECCPKCKGIALLEVTSAQGVFVFEPDPGKEKLKRKTVVDDGVNGPVKIDTSCSKPLEVGDVFGPYTISELVRIFE